MRKMMSSADMEGDLSGDVRVISIEAAVERVELVRQGGGEWVVD